MCLGNEIFSLPTILKIEKYFHSIKMANRKGVYMILDEGDIITKENYANYMGEIIKEGLANPVVRKMCTQSRGMSPEDIKKVEKEFCRFVGYCILFRSSQNVGEYMFLHNREEQMRFLKEKIAEKLGIPKNEIDLRKKEIIEYAYKNFKKNGYVFHAANSASIKMKMATGLRDNIATLQQQKELLYIEQIYRKYSPDTPYSPLGHAAADILENKTGWFFDGFPIHSMGYANSPQWFSYFCGKSYVYFDSIPEERRNGYANRDYRTSLEAIIWLIKDRKMSVEDAKKIVYFFKKCWVEYKDTIPCLMFVPVKDVGINDDIEIEQYLDDEGMELLFDDIILGKVNPGKNYCCKKLIQPEKLSCVDLSPILPRFIIGRENTNGSKDVLNQSNIQHGEDER